MIEGVIQKKLKKNQDERGFVMEILRSDDPIFKKFGQAYITCCQPGFAKAWHFHEHQTDHFICISGKAKVVLYDSRKDSPTYGEINEFTLTMDEPSILVIPEMVFHGFESTTESPCMIINFPTNLYNYKNPDEIRLPFDTEKIAYKWKAKKGG